MSQNLQSLMMRRALIRFAVQTISTEPDGEEKIDVLAHYNGQLASVDSKITEITGTPPPVIVGLKVAVIHPTTGG